METVQHHEPWNKGKLIGQKPPLKQKDIWPTFFIKPREMRSAESCVPALYLVSRQINMGDSADAKLYRARRPVSKPRPPQD